MQLNPNVIVMILEYAEENANGGRTRCVPAIDGLSKVEVDEYLILCSNDGYVEIERWGALRDDSGRMVGHAHSIVRLTTRGHATLADLRSSDDDRPSRRIGFSPN